MGRHELLAMMADLHLSGMRAAYDEAMTDAIRRQHPVPGTGSATAPDGAAARP